MSEYFKAVRRDYTSHYDRATRWTPGETLTVADADPAGAGPCGRGLHCSPTLLDAVCYQRGRSRYLVVEPVDIIASDRTKARCTSVRVLRELSPEETDALAGFRLSEANCPVDPFAIEPDPTLDLESLLREWDSVRASVRDSVRASVRASVRDSVRDSVRASVWDSVWDSVRDSVWASVWDSVWDSVRGSVGASVGASVGGYIGSLFHGITEWRYIDGQPGEIARDPWRSIRALWCGGYVPSYDGRTWRLHAHADARVVATMTDGIYTRVEDDHEGV